jgi:peroxiredoxin
MDGHYGRVSNSKTMTISAQSLAAASTKLKYPGRVPVFYLPSASASGGQAGPAATRSKYNLVLAFVEDSPEGEAYLQALAEVSQEILFRAARVMAVITASIDRARELSHRLRLHFTLLADESGSTTRRLLGQGAHAAICVADRYGIISYLETVASPADLSPAQTAVEWLDYVQMQCPECTDGADSRWSGDE